MDPNGLDMYDIYDQKDVEEYTQYLEDFEQYQALENAEVESSGATSGVGANNDLTVLYGSPLFDELLADKALEAPFVVNGNTYSKGRPGMKKFEAIASTVHALIKSPIQSGIATIRRHSKYQEMFSNL
ncbi:hypothetical protein Tco_0232592 [Tanacetum coccineum]